MLNTMFVLSILLTAVTGIYCLVATRNLIRVLIAMEILNKAASLLLALAGALIGQTARAESYIITLIIVEVVVTAVGALLCVAIYSKNGTLDLRQLGKSKEGEAHE